METRMTKHILTIYNEKLAYSLVHPNEDIMRVPVGNEAIVSQLTLGSQSSDLRR